MYHVGLYCKRPQQRRPRQPRCDKGVRGTVPIYGSRTDARTAWCSAAQRPICLSSIIESNSVGDSTWTHKTYQLILVDINFTVIVMADHTTSFIYFSIFILTQDLRIDVFGSIYTYLSFGFISVSHVAMKYILFLYTPSFFL